MSTRWLSPAQFSALAIKGDTLADIGVRKAASAEVDASKDRRITFTISTASVDRDRDVIEVEGWDLKAYKKNGVVTWAHDYSLPPIARAVKVWKEDRALKATAEFTSAELNPFGDMIYRLYKEGFLGAVSVGFQPDEWVYDEKRGGMNFKRQSLLEFACVPVPTNADCLMEGKAAGIDVEPLKAWAEGVLKGLTPAIVKAPACARGADCPKGDHGDCPEGEGCPMAGKAEIIAPTDPNAPLKAALAELTAKVDALAVIRPTPEPPEAEVVVLALSDDEPEDEGLEMDPEDVRAAFAGALDAIVTTEVRSAINALRGRID